VAKDGIIVHGDPAVSGHQLAIRQLHQRVDLGSAGLVLLSQGKETDQDVRQVHLQLTADAGPADQVAGLELEQSGAHVDMHAGHLVRVGGRDLFDAGAAHAGKEDQRLLSGVVNDHPGIELAGDLQPLLDQDLFHGKVLDAHPQHRSGRLFSLVWVARLFDPSQAGPAGDPGLGLDHHLPTDLFGDAARLLRVRATPPLGTGILNCLSSSFP
jgi:hypothetical protein